MQLSEEAISTFIALYKTHFGIELSQDDAHALAIDLVSIVALTSKSNKM